MPTYARIFCFACVRGGDFLPRRDTHTHKHCKRMSWPGGSFFFCQRHTHFHATMKPVGSQTFACVCWCTTTLQLPDQLPLPNSSHSLMPIPLHSPHNIIHTAPKPNMPTPIGTAAKKLWKTGEVQDYQEALTHYETVIAYMHTCKSSPLFPSPPPPPTHSLTRSPLLPTPQTQQRKTT